MYKFSDCSKMAQSHTENNVKCLGCDYQTSIEDDFLDHVKSHLFEPNFKIPCMFCFQKLKTVELYKKHKKTCVGIGNSDDTNQQKIEPQSEWQCQNCPEKITISVVLTSVDYGRITTHLKKHVKKREPVNCPNNGPSCRSPYNAYTTFNRQSHYT